MTSMSRECHMDDICHSEQILAEGLRYGIFYFLEIMIFFDTEGNKSQFLIIRIVSKILIPTLALMEHESWIRCFVTTKFFVKLNLLIGFMDSRLLCRTPKFSSPETLLIIQSRVSETEIQNERCSFIFRRFGSDHSGPI